MSTKAKRSSGPNGNHREAIVVGASIAGLLAARVLSEHFERVLVLDRDERPDPGLARKGAPQGHHPHLLLQAGYRVLEQLFPGLGAEAQREGASEVDLAQDVRWRQRGVWKARFPSSIRTLVQTRPVLEERIRQRVTVLPNVRLGWRVAAADLSFSSEGDRVDGVWARLPGQAPARLSADLVVDASGCGSMLARQLAAHGYESPVEERAEIGLCYTTGLFRRRARTPLDWRALLLPPDGRRASRGGMAVALDEVYWQVALHGYGGDHAPAELEGFTAFARSLSSGKIAAALGNAILVSDLERYAVPYQFRRRCERLPRVPAGLLAIGDALGRLDPAYAQGMTVAALQAEALASLLARRASRNRAVGSPAFAAEYFARAARIFDLPWRMSGGAAQVARAAGARRTRASALQSWYRRELELASSEVPSVHQAFLEVWNLMAPESRLWRPAIVARVLAHGALLRRKRHAVAAKSPTSSRLASAEHSGALRLATASDISTEIRLR
jgi:2-polyprenyl-6-methoxyphenol hydroxylase-like FAD-dependent oxidoreductase